MRIRKVATDKEGRINENKEGNKITQLRFRIDENKKDKVL